MKKIILILSVLLLSGCATTNPNIINIPKIQPSSEIMKDCNEFEEPIGKSFKDVLNAYSSTIKILKDCSEQNRSKKEFIINNSKY